MQLRKYRNITVSERECANFNEVPAIQIDATNFEKNVISEDSSSFFRNQLNKFEKIIYECAFKISSGTISTLSFEISNMQHYNISPNNLTNQLVRAMGAFYMDHYEFWWIKTYECSYSINNEIITNLTVKIISNYPISEINRLNNDIKKFAQAIANNANKENTAYKKLKYIHDYLIKNIKYDRGDGSASHYNLHGAFINKKCVCEGYSEAFAYVSRLIGFQAIAVRNDTHQWNYINVNNNWYAVDVTWDDPSINGRCNEIGDDSNLRYNYFLVGSDTVVDKNSNLCYKNEKRELLNYIGYEGATGFKYPPLTKTGLSM